MSSKRALAIAAGCCLLALLGARPAPASAAAEAAPSHQLAFTLTGVVLLGPHYIPPPEGEFEDACGVAVDAEGHILISDYYHQLLYRYDAERNYLSQTAVPGPDGPCNLAFDPAGNLYVNNWRENVVRYRPDGAGGYMEPTVIDSARSTGVAVDPASGRIYVDDRSYVAVYEPNGQPVQVAGQPLRIGLGTLQSGYGVAVSSFAGSAGDLYVPDAGAGLVRVYGPAGEELAPLLGLGTPQRGFVDLQDSNVVVDPGNGHVYVADYLQPGFEHPLAVVDEFNEAGEYRGQLPQRIVDAEPTALTIAGGQIYATSGNDEGAALFGFGPTLPAHRLAVALTGTGQGRVTSEPAGINCGTACAAEYNVGEDVILTAVAEPGSAFTGWSGGGCSGTSLCHLTMGADSAVSAEFEALPPAPLSFSPFGAAQVATAATAAPVAATAPSPSSTAPNRHLKRRHHRKIHHRQAKSGEQR